MNNFNPKNEAEASEFLTMASQDKQTVLIIGGGTKLHLGNPSKETNLSISSAGLDRLVDYQPEDLTITVGAGLEFDRLQEILAGQGQLLALDPPAMPGQTVGGVLATNRSGPRRLLYGTARDLLIGCRFVLADGSIGHSGGRVVKNVAGYDLHKLFIGAYGTLGMLTEVSFKVVPQPQVTGAGLAIFSSAESAYQAARRCAVSNLMPSALEVIKDGQQNGKSEYKLYFGAEGVGVAVEGQLAGLRDIIAGFKPDSLEILTEDGGRLWRELADLGAEAAFILKAATTLTGLPRATALLENILNASGQEGVIRSHAGSGVVYLYVASEDIDTGPAMLHLWLGRAELEQSGGSLVVEDAPFMFKDGVDAWGDFGDALPAMQALKHKLDPQGLLNPGVMDL